MTRYARKESLFRAARLPLRLESLEDRTTPATFTVTNLSDAGAGSLRDAIDKANLSTGADVIDFAPAIRGGTVSLTTFFNPPTGNFAGPTGLIVLDEVAIQGTGETITRGGTTPFRLFQVTSTGKLTLQNLTLSNGHAVGGMGDSGGGGAAGLGGAIYNQGSLVITGSTLSGNTAEGNSGLDSIAPTVTGRGGGGLGGGLAGVNGGGPNGGLAVGPGSPRPAGFGGGGHGGNFGAGNEPQNGGFGGGGGGGFAGFDGGGNGGFGGGGGAGLRQAAGKGFGGFGGGNGSLNTVGNGGGGAGMGGAVTIANSTLTDNTAVGGIGDGDSQQGGGFGGGVFNLNGNLTLTNVSFSNNVVSNGVIGATNVAEGGAVYNLSLNVGAVTPTQIATVTVANSILANSRVGLASTNRGPDVVNNQVNGTATVNATGPNIASAAVVNTGGTVTGTAITVANPNFGLTTENGGFTKTLSLNAGSPAIDAGSNTVAASLTTDQRGPGFPRISNGTVDIGAFEVQIPVVVDPGTLPNGRVNVAYSQTLTASGPIGPFTFTVTAGTLPPGITLANTGVLSGTPTQAGAFAFTVTATNATAETGSRAYTLTINPPPPAQPASVGGLLDGTARALTPSGGKYDLGNTLSFFPGQTVNVRTATADVTGDGVPDFVGGTGPGTVTRVAVRDGATGKEVVSWQPFESGFTGGVFVAAADIDGDGKAEVVVSPDQGGGPVAAVFAGSKLAAGTGGDAAQIVRYFGIDDPDFRGGARPALGDVTGDGKADVIVSAGFLGGPRITIWDGASVLGGTPAQRLNFFAFEDTLRNGAFVAAGDVTRDGVADIAFGGGPGGAPRVRVFDGKALLAAGPFTNLDEVGAAQEANFFAGDSSLRGGVRLSLRDADGDARADLVTGSGEGEASRVRVFRAGNLLANSSPTADQELDPFAGTVLTGGVFVG